MGERLEQFFWVGLMVLTMAIGFGTDYWIIDETSKPGGINMHPGASILLVAGTALCVGLVYMICIDQMVSLNRRRKEPDKRISRGH